MPRLPTSVVTVLRIRPEIDELIVQGDQDKYGRLE